MDIPDDILDQTWKANATAGGVYITQHGIYDLLLKTSMFKSIKEVGRCFITELRVLAAQKQIVQVGEEVVDEEPHPVGYEPAYVVNYDGEAKLSADGNAKALVLAAFGLDEKKVPEDEFKRRYREMVSDAQPLRGLVIRATTYAKGVRSSRDPQTREIGRYIVLPRWSSLGVLGQGENTVEKVAQRRVEIERGIAQQAARQAVADPVFVPAAPALPSQPTMVPVLPAGWFLHPKNTPADAADPWCYKADGAIKRRSEIAAGG